MTGLHALTVLSSFSTSRKFSQNRSSSPLGPVALMYTIFAKSASYAVDDIG